MTNLATEAARTHNLDEKSLRLTLAETTSRSYGAGATVIQALEEGRKRGIDHAMVDGIITWAEESRLREFQGHLALADASADRWSG